MPRQAPNVRLRLAGRIDVYQVLPPTACCRQPVARFAASRDRVKRLAELEIPK